MFVTPDMTPDKIPSFDQPPMPLRDEDALDIADYLRAEGDADSDIHEDVASRQGLAALTIGAIGVVYGDIGTSPLYAFREALRATGMAPARPEVLGILSLLFWTIILIVTVKYVFVLLRADNRGEGGILALYTLVRLAIGRRSVPILFLAIAGAALFAGDAVITPAMSVLSAVEGAVLVVPSVQSYVVPTTIVILLILFLAQQRGTASVARLFGPVTVIWFLTLAGLGLWHLTEYPDVLVALNPVWAIRFLIDNAKVAFAVLGAVFLAVTGGEALYADLGHFGRKPITLAWFGLVLPSLLLNYFGQGAMVLEHPERAANSFFAMSDPAFLPVLVALATVATVIASQAVISGAFSMARSAVQLGFLPRLVIRHTASDQSGQIYIAAINGLLLFGVIWIVLVFGDSSSLASAYGIAVTGTMVLTTTLGVLYAIRAGLAAPWLVIVVALPIALIELVFLASNLTKFADGGYIPVAIAVTVGFLMWVWWRGTQAMLMRVHKLAVPLDGFLRAMRGSSVHRVVGTAFFLTGDPEVVPSALLHNLKHNRVLHEQTVFLTVETLRVPYATAEERTSLTIIDGGFVQLILRFGFMETPNVSRAMAHARRAGLKFDVMASTFFLGRRRPVATGSGLELLLDRIFAKFSRLAADPSDFYHLPRDRVVELGERIAI
jgi:KUP system potassium uptake protein